MQLRSSSRLALRATQAEVPSPKDLQESVPKQKHSQTPVEARTPPKKRKAGKVSQGSDEMPSSEKEKSLDGSQPSENHTKFTIEIPLSSLSKRSRHVEAQDSDDGSGDDTAQFKTPLEKKRIVFEDDDHEVFVTPLEAPLKNPLENILDTVGHKEEDQSEDDEAEDKEDEEEEEEDDDAPPEAISSHAAKAQNKKAADAAVKAAERQADAKKQKRKERENFFTEQARSRRATKDATAEPGVLQVSGVEAGPEEVSTVGAGPESSRKRKHEAPGLLPLELLESDDEEEEARQQALQSTLKSKKVKLDVAERLTQHDAKPLQDERVGSTVYRVMGDKGNGKLAPKVTKESWQLRQKLLARHRVPEKKSGFLVKNR